jgi:predicted ABC-type ATPase
MAKYRVAERLAHGGHDIPGVDIERRFARSLDNLFNEYRLLVDRTRCYLNSNETPETVFVQEDKEWHIKQPETMELLQRLRKTT